MTTKPITLREEIEKHIKRIWNKGFDAGEASMGGLWVQEEVKELITLINKAVVKAIPPKEECYKDFNPKKSFTENLENSQKMARNQLKDQIRASFKDIVEGKIRI